MTEETTAVESTETATVSESLLDAVQSSNIFANGKPEGFPDDFWDADKNAPVTEKLYEAYTHEKNRAEGLRKKLSKGEFEGGAPEDIKEYVVELDDNLKTIVPDGDPLFEAAREAAKQAGLPKDAFAKFVKPVIAKIAELAPKEPTAEEVQAYKAAELEKLGPSGLKVAANVKAFIGELEAKGVLLADDVKAVQGMITNADQLRAFNRIRNAMTNTQDVPSQPQISGQSGPSKAELEAALVAAANARDEEKYNAIRVQLHKFAT